MCYQTPDRDHLEPKAQHENLHHNRMLRRIEMSEFDTSRLGEFSQSPKSLESYYGLLQNTEYHVLSLVSSIVSCSDIGDYHTACHPISIRPNVFDSLELHQARLKFQAVLSLNAILGK